MKRISIVLLALMACKKQEPVPDKTEVYIQKCSNWEGIWFCFAGDSIMKDSVVLEVDTYGIKNNKSFVQYKCSASDLNPLFWHYCPYQETSDDIHIVYKGKNMYFRYFH